MIRSENKTKINSFAIIRFFLWPTPIENSMYVWVYVTTPQYPFKVSINFFWYTFCGGREKLVLKAILAYIWDQFIFTLSACHIK